VLRLRSPRPYRRVVGARPQPTPGAIGALHLRAAFTSGVSSRACAVAAEHLARERHSIASQPSRNTQLQDPSRRFQLRAAVPVLH